jgi:hypothetical protein
MFPRFSCEQPTKTARFFYQGRQKSGGVRDAKGYKAVTEQTESDFRKKIQSDS